MAQEMSLEAYAADCRTRGLTQATVRLYGYHINTYLAFLQARGKEVLQADRLDIRDHLDELRSQGLRTKSLHQHLLAISSLYEYLIFEGQAFRNPVHEVRRRLRQYKAEGERQTHKIISVEEAAELVEVMVDIRDKALVLLLFKTGIRKNELISLDVGSINWKDNSITLKPNKKRSNRKVFFDEETAYYLRRWLEVREKRKGANGPALFLSSHGGRLSRGVDYVINEAAVGVGLHDSSSDRMEDHFSAHCCRHWFTTHLRRAGMPREFIQELRGDVRREAIDIYDHIDKEELRKSYLAHIPQLGV